MNINISAYRNIIVFVESPNKVNAFKKIFDDIYQNNNVYIISTKGHIAEIDTCLINDFNQVFNLIYKPHVKTILNRLKSIDFCITKDLIILSTDPDREGEAISWYLIKYLQSNFGIEINYIRLRCNSITKKSIIDNILHINDSNKLIDKKLIDAYFSRVFIDMLIGINGSSLLWKKIYGCKSMGRVQSIVIYMLFERERLIQEFIPRSYKKLSVINDNDIKISKVTYNNIDIEDLSDDQKIYLAEKYNNVNFKVEKISNEVKSMPSISPLDITSLASSSNSEFGFSIKEVYRICQNLYEGINFMDNKIGIITYMRTDSKIISPNFIPDIYKFIKTHFNEDDINYNFKSPKQDKYSQEAHEAIRVNDLSLDLESLIQNLNIKEKKIFKKILFHTIGPFMKSPKYNKINYLLTKDNIKIHISSYEYIYDGYYKLLNKFDIPKNTNKQFINLSENDEISFQWIVSDEITKNYDRYTEGSLISDMKKLGIGRPSTYGYITDVIKNRYYSMINNNKYYLTSSGFILSWLIKLFMFDIINYELTADMESKLDDIVNGKISKIEVLKFFFNKIMSSFKFISDNHSREEIISRIQNEMYQIYGANCKCNKPYLLRFINNNAVVICEDSHIIGLHTFGYRNDNFLKYQYIKSNKTKKIKKFKKNK
ncbi:DNA topoisomerase I [uncultured bacterium]|nr:DNA topoisomerase I [uncultured bacterium]